MNFKPVYTIPELSELLGCSRGRTLRALRRRQCKMERLDSGSYIVLLPDLDTAFPGLLAAIQLATKLNNQMNQEDLASYLLDY